MTIRYTYNCNACGRSYIEQRQAEEQQYFYNCGCSGTFELVNEEEL